MNIIIRKSVRSEIADTIPGLINKSLDWMRKKYPDVNFDNVDFIFSAGYRRSRYFRNEITDGKYLTPNVCVCTRALLMLYNKPSIGIKKNQLFVGSAVQMVCALIHELTHHVQYETGVRKGNELDTTRNELEYLRVNHTEYYNKIIKQ